MKIIFDFDRKKAYNKLQSFMFWNPEYSRGQVWNNITAYSKSGWKRYLGGRFYILVKHSDSRIKEMKSNLAYLNYRIPKELRYSNLKDK